MPVMELKLSSWGLGPQQARGEQRRRTVPGEDAETFLLVPDCV